MFHSCFSSKKCPVKGCDRDIAEDGAAHDRTLGGQIIHVCAEHDVSCTATWMAHCTCPEIDYDRLVAPFRRAPRTTVVLQLGW